MTFLRTPNGRVYVNPEAVTLVEAREETADGTDWVVRAKTVDGTLVALNDGLTENQALDEVKFWVNEIESQLDALE